MTKLTIYIFCILNSFMLFSLKADAQSCNCKEALDFTIKQFEENYAGFQDKVHEKNRKTYNAFTKKIQNKAASVTEGACFKLIQEWISFFKDKHAFISVRGTPIHFPQNATAGQIRELVRSAKSVPMQESDVRRYLAANKKNLHPIEGIWQGNKMQYAIIKQPGSQTDFVGFVLKGDSLYWMPGHVSFEFKINNRDVVQAYVYNRARYSSGYSTLIDRNVLILGQDHYRYEKVYPEVSKPHNYASYKPQLPNTRFEVKAIDSQTVYLSIPLFIYPYKNILDSMILANTELLQSKPYLIIDLRGNGGGSDQLHKPILPFLYTGPIYHKKFQLWASPANFERQVKSIQEYNGDTEETKAYIESMRKYIGGFMPKVTDTIQFNQVLPNPQKIAILVDRNTGSSAEVFVLKAKQSNKTVLIGENTTGVVDYGDMVPATIPCQNTWEIRYPIIRSSRLPEEKYDETGITPQVRVPNSTSDWIEFARQYLHQHFPVHK